MEDSLFKTLTHSLLKDGTLSDFTITCGDQTYKTHRSILACHSLYFKKLFSGDYKEATERKIDLKEDNTAAVDLMIKYFYAFDYLDTRGEDSPFTSRLELNAAVYLVADKYEATDLKALATRKFAVAARDPVSHNEDPQGAITLVFSGDMPTANQELRDMLVEYWLLFGWTVAANLNDDLISRVIRASPDFAVALAERATKGLTYLGHVTCLSHYAETYSDESVANLCEKLCNRCRKPLSEHKGLKITRSEREMKPFWTKYLEG